MLIEGGNESEHVAARAAGPSPLVSSASVVRNLVHRIVDQLPIGIAIRDTSHPVALYMNDEAARGQVEDERAFDLQTQTIAVDGRLYEVTTSVDATQQRRRESELTRRAFFDDLTELPKRDLFERTVNNLIAEDCPPFALSFIDVDNFKYINDYYGHAVGDQLLKKIARRISDSMRPTDLLARVGGDEFMLLLTPLASLDDPVAEIAHLIQRFREPFFIDGYEIFCSASIGVSVYPLHGREYDVIRANADSAMYRVKGTTKGSLSLFDASLGRAATERMEAEQRLRFAIRDKRLGCAFQPKVDFRTNEIVGVEVLLRWLDENGDFRAPGDLIKVAIELGLMDDIALIVLDQVRNQIDLINDAFGPNASISLNIAAKQATDFEFMSKFGEALHATGYAERFILELTEEAFLCRGEFQLKILPMLRAFGLRVSIDDFGVGYSSLSSLAEITADELKVDRSFITDIHKKPRNQNILKVIELLSHSLGMTVVVEGVETFEELAYILAATRINCGQGYYFAKPVILQASSRGPAPQADRRDASLPREAGWARQRSGRGRF